MTIMIDKWEVNDMAPTYSRMTQPLYEVRSGIYTTCDEEIDFIVELVREIERLQGRIIQLDDTMINAAYHVARNEKWKAWGMLMKEAREDGRYGVNP